MAPPFISDALDRMTKRLWYLYHDSGLYRFDSRPNLNRILVDREEMVRSEPDKVRDFAKSDAQRPDRRCRLPGLPLSRGGPGRGRRARLSLVVLDLHQMASEDEMPKETEDFVTRHPQAARQGVPQARQRAGLPGPRQAAASEVIDAARRLLALRSIDEDKTTKKQLTEEQLKDLADRLKEAEARLPCGPDDGLPAHPRARREEDAPLLRHGHFRQGKARSAARCWRSSSTSSRSSTSSTRRS